MALKNVAFIHIAGSDRVFTITDDMEGHDNLLFRWGMTIGKPSETLTIGNLTIRADRIDAIEVVPQTSGEF